LPMGGVANVSGNTKGKKKADGNVMYEREKKGNRQSVCGAKGGGPPRESITFCQNGKRNRRKIGRERGDAERPAGSVRGLNAQTECRYPALLGQRPLGPEGGEKCKEKRKKEGEETEQGDGGEDGGV